MANARESKQQFWREFLALYREFPALWKVKSKEYYNRTAKKECYAKLIEKLREIDPKANRSTVVQKINTFRCNYRRELNKVLHSMTSATKPDCVYRPTVWYFKELTFLNDQGQESTASSLTDEDSNYSIEKPIYILEDSQEQNEDPVSSRATPKEVEDPLTDCQSLSLPYQNNHDEAEDHATSASKKRKRARMRPVPTGEDKFAELLTQVSTYLKKDNDPIACLAKSWAHEFGKLSEDQQIYARKGISDILFEAQLGTLHRDSIKINVSSNQNLLEPATDYVTSMTPTIKYEAQD